jgi:hypothetical protein
MPKVTTGVLVRLCVCLLHGMLRRPSTASHRMLKLFQRFVVQCSCRLHGEWDGRRMQPYIYVSDCKICLHNFISGGEKPIPDGTGCHSVPRPRRLNFNFVPWVAPLTLQPCPGQERLRFLSCNSRLTRENWTEFGFQIQRVFGYTQRDLYTQSIWLLCRAWNCITVSTAISFRLPIEPCL